jgi:transcriptional regulator with XRE-family HTH domain
MDASSWPEENWVVLGDEIAKARRAKGWDQQELANRSGSSANTISNYERGRAGRSRRVPSGYLRVAEALGWPPDAPQLILSGEDPEMVLNRPTLFELARGKSSLFEVPREQKNLFDLSRHGGGGELAARASFEASGEVSTATSQYGRMSSRDIELTQSGHLAQDVFMRQAKRYRELQELSIEQLAKKLAGKEPPLSEDDIRCLEDGTRLLRMAEGKAIATALETTVDWLLGSGFSSDAPEVMKWPPNAEELQAEANAVLRRMADVGMQVNAANQQLAAAQQRMRQAQQEAAMAESMFHSALAQQREMEKNYQYLLGRIDSIRAARGEETVIQIVPVYEGDENRAREDDLEDPPFTE